jgi:prolyl-tRNA synthetase
MKYSQSFIVTRRDAPADAEIISHQLMIRAGMIRKIAAGMYAMLPLGLRVLQKVENVIRDEMNRSGAQELSLPIALPRELMDQTGRWDLFGGEMFRLKDRHERDFYLGPTHEEPICSLVADELRSYKQLPWNLYQITPKFRDEIRPRFGVMRGRSFLMKDSYSFDLDEAAAKKTYQTMFETYQRIFSRCGLNFRPVEAMTGVIGGSLSHEFQVLAESGEDEILACSECDYALSREKAEELDVTDKSPCSLCQAPLKIFRGIEVGHVFYLGQKYSDPMNVHYLDASGKEATAVMGCYGIGVDRTMAAAIEQHHDDDGIIWPTNIAPFAVEMLSLKIDDSQVAEVSEKLYGSWTSQGHAVLWDERSESAGVKFKDADLIGIPLQVIIGSRGLQEGCVELKDRRTKEKFSFKLDQIDEEIKRRICK